MHYIKHCPVDVQEIYCCFLPLQLKSYQKKISKRRKHDDSHPGIQQPNGDATFSFQSALLDLDNGSELHVSVSKSDACSQTISRLNRPQCQEISQVPSASTSSLLTPSQPIATPASEPSLLTPSQPISTPADLSSPSPVSQASQLIPSPASESSQLLCSESSLLIPSPASESSQLLSSESSLLTPSPASESSLLVSRSGSISSSQLIGTAALCDMQPSTDATTVVSQKAPEHTVPSKRKSNRRRRKSWGRRKRKRSSVSSSTDDTDEVVDGSDKACSSAALPPTSVETSASEHTVNSANDFAEFSGYHSVIAPQPSGTVFTQLSQLPRYRYLHKYLSQAYRRMPQTSQITAVQSATTTAFGFTTSVSHSVASNSETVMCSSATMYDRATEFIQQYERAGLVNNLADPSSTVPQPSGRMFTDLSQVPKQQYMYKHASQVAVQTSISTGDTVVSVSSATSSTGTHDAVTPDNYSTASNLVSLSMAQNLGATPQRCNMYLYPPTPHPAHLFPAHPFPGTYPDYAYIAAMRYHQRYSFPLSSSASASPYYFHNTYPSASIPHHMPGGYSGTSGYGGYGSTGVGCLTSRNSHSMFASNTAAIASDSITPSPMLPEPVVLIDTPVTTTTCSISHSTHIQSTSKCQAITSLPTEISQPSTSGILTDEDPDSDHIAVAVSALLDLNSAPVLEPVDITITSTPPPLAPIQSISTTASDSTPLPVALTSTVTSSSIPPPVVSIQTRISTGIDVGVGTSTQPPLTPNISTPISVTSQASTATTTSPVAPIHTTGVGSVGVCYSVSPMQGHYGPNNVTNTIGRCISSVPRPSSQTDCNSILAGSTLLSTHPHSATNLEQMAGGNRISPSEDTSQTVNTNVDKYSHQTASRCVPLSNLLQVSKSKPRVRSKARTSGTGTKCTAAVSMWQYYENVNRLEGMNGTLLVASEVEPAYAQSEVVIVRLKNSAYCQRKRLPSSST